MSELVCPHCRESVPRGATVCRGCQAEIEYGAPSALYFILLIASVFAGVKISGVVPASLSLLGWPAGITVLVGAGALLRRMFADRASFKRIYKTR